MHLKIFAGKDNPKRHPTGAIACLIGICILVAALMLWTTWTDSAINDEIAHIPAGYDYVRHLTYNLNPEHPPLIKALASASTILLQPNFPTTNLGGTNSTTDEWTIGGKFLYESGNNADMIVRIARLAPIAITILTIIFIYLLSRMFMGQWWSLAPSFLFALDPTVLAHGHYVTTDVGAAFGVVTATYYFLQHLVAQSKRSLWCAGIAFGIAQLTKFSTIILIPFFFLLHLVRQIDAGTKKSGGEGKTQKIGTKPLRDLVYIFLIGYAIVYAVYALFTVNYPLSRQVIDTVAMLRQRLGDIHGLGSFDVWMAGNAILRPFAQYLLGILTVTSHVSGGTFAYAFGQVSLGSGWWYFPAIFLLKEPLPTLIIILVALGAGLVSFFTRMAAHGKVPDDETKRNPHHAFFVFALLSFIVAYWCVSMTSPLDHGIRYLIPTLPFIYVLSIYAWNVLLRPVTNSPGVRRIARTAGFCALCGLLLWLSVETLFTAPNFLSYYNELGGGTWNGYHWATDSNYDWGQDLLRFQSFMNQHPEISSIAVGDLGRADIHYYLGNRAVDWSSAQGNPADAGIHWFAVSIDTLEMATQPMASGLARNASDTYAWLTALRPAQSGMGNVPAPDYRVGMSIFVYHL